MSRPRSVSLVFCHQPNYDAPLACLPSCLPRVGAPKFGTVSSGVHLARKLAQ